MRQHYALDLAKSPMETGVKPHPISAEFAWLAQDSSRQHKIVSGKMCGPERFTVQHVLK